MDAAVDFLTHAAPGTRVVVRHRVDGGLSDALGVLVACAGGWCTVRTRRGDVIVPLHRVTAAKQVPQPPPQRHRKGTA